MAETVDDYYSDNMFAQLSSCSDQQLMQQQESTHETIKSKSSREKFFKISSVSPWKLKSSQNK